MGGEITGAWQQLIDQGPVVAILVIAVFYAGKYISKTLEEANNRENAREQRYNALVDTHLTQSAENVRVITSALVGNTEVLKRVERKLDEN